MSNNESFNHDIIIIGGGATGLLLGILLLLNKVDCCILEKQQSRGADTKATMLNAVNVNLFKYLDLINELDLSFSKSSKFNFHLNYKKMFELDFEDEGYYLMIQPRLEEILENKYIKLGGIIKKNRTVEDFQELEDSILLNVTIGNTVENYTTKYAVGCDGAQSIIRKFSKIDFVKVNAIKNAFVTEGVYNADFDKDVHMFLSDNDATSLIPLPNLTVRVGGLIANVENQEELLNKKLMLINSEVERYTPNKMVILKIQEGYAKTFYKDRFILVGDAAHSVFPFGGQGLNYAFQDVFNLSWRLNKIIKNGDDYPDMLHEYDKERRLLFMDVINTADFSNLFTKIRSTNSYQEFAREFLPLTKKLTHLYFNYSDSSLFGKKFLFQPHTLFPINIKLENNLSITQTNIVCHRRSVSKVKLKNVNICIIDEAYDLMCDYIIVRPDLVIQESVYN